LAIFVDGDFWHGYRYPLWADGLAEFWRVKISGNRQRDQRNFRRLRAAGWKVIRLWQHQVEKNIDRCLSRVMSALATLDRF
jgi:DNA mismatch endonuclease (patch repair protein)